MKDMWFKSTHSNPSGSCVEARWRKSSHSSNEGDCVEVRHDGVVQVRDSTLGDASVVLSVPSGAWTRFLAGIR